MLLVRRIMWMMLLMVEQHCRACDLTVGHIRSEADTLQWHLINWSYLLCLKLVALNCWRAIRCSCSTVVGIELNASCLNVSVGWISVALWKDKQKFRTFREKFFQSCTCWKSSEFNGVIAVAETEGALTFWGICWMNWFCHAWSVDVGAVVVVCHAVG